MFGFKYAEGCILVRDLRMFDLMVALNLRFADDFLFFLIIAALVGKEAMAIA
jgi:hypothetical protein